jgi:hypothetical protein
MTQASMKWPIIYGMWKFCTIFAGAWSFVAFGYMLIITFSPLTELEGHSDFRDPIRNTCSHSPCVETFFSIRAISSL